MRRLILLLLLLNWSAGATTFTEFYCESGVGTNINSGSTTAATASYTSINGNWDGTSVFTPTDGTYPADTNGVASGAWASIFIDGSTNLIQSSAGGCIMLITNVAAGANGAITFDRRAFAGVSPSSSATGRSIKVGGAWNGPFGIVSFPFNFMTNTATNGPGLVPRVNFKNTASYAISTPGITHGYNGPMRFQGMTATPGDGGKFTIDGGATGTSYQNLTVSGARNDFVDMIVMNNGNSGSPNNAIYITGNYNLWLRVIVHDVYGYGLDCGAFGQVVIECEAYNCGKATGSTYAGFKNDANSLWLRCISHDNSNPLVNGWYFASQGTMVNCISYKNGRDGVRVDTGGNPCLVNCDFWNNASNGVEHISAALQTLFVQNCNFLKNGRYGISSSGSSTLRNGEVINSGFGTGTQANALGDYFNLAGINVQNNQITYAANITPWTDPTNGNFTINLAAAKSAGRGVFLQQLVNSPTNTVSYPDIGAAQSASTNSASAGGAYTWAQ